MVKTGMKELDIDTMSASLEQTLHSASDMIGLGSKQLISYKAYSMIHIETTSMVHRLWTIQFVTFSVEKFHRVLDGILVKLSRYDEGTFSSSILSFTKPNMETANEFVKVSQRN